MKNNTTSGGIGFFGLLQIAFIVLKLIGKIDWSWTWVLAPTWIPFVVVFAIVIICMIALYASGRKGF